MPRDWELRLQDILNACRRIISLIQKVDYKDFINDNRNPDAISFNFVIIGEAIKDLPEEIIRQFPDIDWKGYAKFRDFLTHRYFDISTEMIWEAANHDIYILVNAIEEIVK